MAVLGTDARDFALASRRPMNGVEIVESAMKHWGRHYFAQQRAGDVITFKAPDGKEYTLTVSPVNAEPTTT